MGFFSKIFKKVKESEIVYNTNEDDPTVSKSINMKIAGDNPITLPEEDTIGRTSFAKSFAQQILSLDTRTGSVVGVLGAWGSGKTSFINLVRNELYHDEIAILDFNPWMFSGTEQLMQSFFTELSAQLRLRPDLSNIGEALGTYGELFAGMGWIPLVGPWIERGHKGTEALSKIMQGRKEGVLGQRKKIEKALAELDNSIVVVIDDIDRLSTSEIRDVFKLVRLTANFPNIIYIVAFDRLRVEHALDEEGINGRDYLEKILQVAVDIPPIPYQVLSTQALLAIDTAIKGVERPGTFDDQIWPDIFMEIIRPLISTMRDVRRYAVNIRNTVSSLGGEVALPDVLALEVIRIFMPDVFKMLHPSIDALTTTDELTSYRSESGLLKAKIEKILETSKGKEEIIRAVITRLFPAARRHIENMHYGHEWKSEWLRNRRVAHEDILHLYLEHFVGEPLKAFLNAEKAWLFMNDCDLLNAYLRSLDISETTSVIASFEFYEEQYRPEHVEPASIVLLNLLPELPDNRKGMFDYDARTKVMRVVYRLIRSLKDPGLIETAVTSILPKINTLSAKNELIGIIGYAEGRGHKLVAEEAAKQFELNWAHEVKTASKSDLLKEHDLLRILFHARKLLYESYEEFVISDNSEITLAIIKSAKSEAMSQSVDSRVVKKEVRLAWNALVELYGNEDKLKQQIEQAMSLASDDNNELLELADKYAKGWRPGDFMENS